MNWIEAYATGEDKVDQQHKMLFQLADDFQIALAEGTCSESYDLFLNQLVIYAKGHFGYEEKCMAQHACPAAELNKAAHGKFIGFVTGFREHYDTYGYVHGRGQELANALQEWLKSHICSIDVQLRTCPSLQGNDSPA